MVVQQSPKLPYAGSIPAAYANLGKVERHEYAGESPPFEVVRVHRDILQRVKGTAIQIIGIGSCRLIITLGQTLSTLGCSSVAVAAHC